MIDEFEEDDRRRQAARFRPVRHAPADTGHMFVMMSCPGREDVTKRTNASLVAGGLREWTGPVSFFSDDKRRGQAAAFFDVLRVAEATSGVHTLTLVEDDIAVAKNALTYISTTKLEEDVALTSWFYQQIPATRPVGHYFYIDKAAVFSCNQAITMPMQTIRTLLASDILKTWKDRHLGDMIFSRVMPEANVAYHFPGLVQHTGVGRSMADTPLEFVTPGGSPTFVGEDFDAFDLTR
ncbi:MAG TPA: hypothetical protein VGY48_15200 [Vicinamibacterales bacterium]|jgi:hypothetical protein|nr:hypothetical protein [Vicinamibacterales bacterium]